MVIVQFKEYHLCFIGALIKNSGRGNFSNIYANIKQVIKAQHYAADELVSITVEVEDLVAVYDLLGQKQERYAAKPNAEMAALLTEQITSALQSDIADAAKADYARLAALLQAKQASFDVVRDLAIVEGRAALLA